VNQDLGPFSSNQNGIGELGEREQGYVSMPLIKKRSITLRKYQEEIYEICKDSNNLIVLPTGLGKTVIAAMLAAHRLLVYPTSKVVFLAPTKPLAKQHKDTFLRIIDLDYEDMCLLTGETKARVRASLWSKGRIVFATPQVVVSDLSKGGCDLCNVSLIIFDEAHRAVGNYAYVGIAQQYFRQAIDAQTIGLTASPGWSQEEISEIKKNLRSEHIEARTETSMDVIPFIKPMEIQWVRVQLGPELSLVGRLIDEMTNERLTSLVEYGLINEEDAQRKSRRTMVGLLRELTGESKKGPSVTPMATYHGLTLSAQVIRLSYCEELLNTQGLNELGNYLDKIILKAKSPRSSNALKELASDIRFTTILDTVNNLLERGVEHPKLAELLRILKEQVHAKQNSRILVFAQFRDTVKHIVEEVRHQGISTSLFVGHGRAKGFPGMTQVKQAKVLRDFKDGLYSALVATSVAEEGLDIAECDLVVMYDAVPSEVRYIQRRRRVSRHHEGRVVTLITAGTQDERYYLSAISKEKKMRDIISRVKEEENMKIEEFVLGVSDKANQKAISNEESSKECKSGKEDTNSGNSSLQEGDDLPIKTTDQPQTVILDRSMENSQLHAKLKERHLNPIIRSTTAADCIIGGEVGIAYVKHETLRKDKDGYERLRHQVEALRETFEVPLIIYQSHGCSGGDEIQRKTSSLHILTAYFTVVERVHFIAVDNEEEASDLIDNIARVSCSM
jgi:ERCC4-related helicase